MRRWLGAAAAAVVSSASFVVLIAISTGNSAAADREIAAAPAFNARQLVELPRQNWITNGGSTFNQRYSPLTLLDRDNIKDLKALWRTSMGSGALPSNSGQAQILHYEGVLYVINGANDVFALDVDTGAILWKFQGNPEPKAGVPMGRSSRGVALGDGKVFVAQLDAKVVALDQKTGKVVWSTEPEERVQREERQARMDVLHGPGAR
jgi:quinohemoprotein ethanol dehydrogenase